VENTGSLFERPTTRGAQLEYRHPLDGGIVRSPLWIDSHHARVLDPQLFL
jgi:hypothetical protein